MRLAGRTCFENLNPKTEACIANRNEQPLDFLRCWKKPDANAKEVHCAEFLSTGAVGLPELFARKEEVVSDLCA